jgi:hypothetical protein
MNMTDERRKNLSIIDQAKQEYEKIVDSVNRDFKVGQERKNALYKLLQKKHQKGNNTFYLGRDDFRYYEEILDKGWGYETVKCPICLGEKTIRASNKDILAGFEENAPCPLCHQHGEVFFIYGYHYHEIDHDDSYYQRW